MRREAVDRLRRMFKTQPMGAATPEERETESGDNRVTEDGEVRVTT